jgi:TolA-binding protein
MKPFRRTQVITLMAACAISKVWGQQLPGPTQPPGGQQAADLDAVRAQIEAAKEQAAAARDSLRFQIKEDTLLRTKEIAQDAIRAVQDGLWKDGVWKDIEGLTQIDLQGMKMELAQEIAPRAPQPPQAPQPRQGLYDEYTRGLAERGSYEQGKRALDNHNYDRAVEIFDKVINAKTPSTHADGAYYWKAYALNKLGKRDEALAALAALSKQFPQSSWLNDAKALQAEVQQGKGQPVSPENQADEDLKLYAINALMGSDADRAVPLLEGLLANPKMSPRLKERALFVLAQSKSDKAHEIVGRYAKGGSNPDLQLTAVEYLGTYRSKESRQLLADVYGSVSDINVKRAVLRGFMISRDVEHLAAIAKSEQNAELRREAIRQLGMTHDDQAVATLVSIYGSESDKDSKTEILNFLAAQGAVKQMIDCARKESDPEVKRFAVQRLGQMKSKEALDFIAELLK